jgi:hypothetical protein
MWIPALAPVSAPEGALGGSSPELHHSSARADGSCSSAHGARRDADGGRQSGMLPWAPGGTFADSNMLR